MNMRFSSIILRVNRDVRLMMYSLLSLTLFSSSLWFMVMSSDAHAQSKPSDNIRHAQNFLIEGNRLLSRGRYRQALSQFKSANELVPDVKTSVIIGAIYVKLDRCVDAFKTWQDGLRLCNGCSKAREIKKKLNKYTKQCASRISVTSKPRAQVSIDGVVVGDTPYKGLILRGRHQIQLSARSHEMISLTRVVTPPKTLKISEVLSPSGQLMGVSRRPVSTPPPRVTPPPRPLPPPPLTLMPPPEVKPSFQDSLQPPSPFQEGLPSTLAMRNQKIRRGLWISTLVLSLVGGGLIVYSDLKYDKFLPKLDSLKVRDQDLADEVDRAENAQSIGVVTFIVAGTNLITSLLFLDD